MKTYQFVKNLWDDATASKLDPVGRLVYRSNILGADQRITNTGGGNTSSKIMEKDPLTGAQTEVLWVKGSGGDLRTSKRENFSSLYQDKLDRAAEGLCRARRARAEVAGRGRHGRDVHSHDVQPEPARLVDRHAAAQLHRPASTWITCIRTRSSPSPRASAAEKLTQEIFGGEMEYVEWMRPGFELGLAMQEIEKREARHRRRS